MTRIEVKEVSPEMMLENGDVCNVLNVCWRESFKPMDQPLERPI